MQNNKTNTWIWVALVVILGIGLIIWGKQSYQKKQSSQTSREVALLCTTDMATKFHIHPELAIMINGEAVPLPSNIGIKPECMASIHTHEGGGIIHVESPIKKDFTLGDFFAVWEKEFSKDQVLDHKTNAGATIVVTVDGVRVDTYENTILRDGGKIVISYQSR